MLSRFLLALLALCPHGLAAATLAGKPAVGGTQIEITFPIAPQFQAMAAQGGNPTPTQGRAFVSFPPGFDPARPWPILVVTSTSDFGRTSPMDAPWYRPPADAEGWVVLAPDAVGKPRIDSTPWRLGALAAALEAVRKEWPQSRRWPVAFAGFSGGSKHGATMGAMLAKGGVVRPAGFFLSGMNEDRLGQGYQTYRLPDSFRSVPVWLSSGRSDTVATPADQERVRASLVKLGFSRVRLESFPGDHAVSRMEVRRALRWFREVGKW